jgi:hypothetical protein
MYPYDFPSWLSWALDDDQTAGVQLFLVCRSGGQHSARPLAIFKEQF